MKTMNITNKKVITEIISERFSMTKKEAGEIVDTVFDTISESLVRGDRVDITGFGKFEVKTRAARMGINPQTGEPIEISATKIPGFKASKSLKDMIK